MNTYKPVIGLEVHVELKTKSKMFCSCASEWFGKVPNSNTCPVCLGLPGALPVPNRKAIELCVMIGMALGCEIPLLSKFDRKNYFYPDLAKGYQISQYEEPFAIHGKLTLSTGKVIRIRRAHMEEDTGKLIHETLNRQKVSLIDFNRSGVPLVEIVTEPDFENAKEVKEYLQKLQQIVRYLDVANADMDKGEMRLEPNISLRKNGQEDLPSYKVEVKNINSFSFVEKAIEYEIKRQTELLDKNEKPKQETRGWNEAKKATISQRSKEEAADYRYFPEPDIPPITWEQTQLSTLNAQLPELPDVKTKRFVKEFGLSEYNAEQLTREREIADYFEQTVLDMQNTKYQIPNTDIANWIINKKIDIATTVPAELIQQILKASSVSGISEEELDNILKKIVEQNSQVVTDYKKGKTTAIMFLVGQAMKELKGKEKADKVKTTLENLLQ